MPTLANPRGISSRSVIDVPDDWSASWFRQFIRTQLANADIRNANSGTGIIITGVATTPATVSISTDLQALFHQPYVLASLPTGISGAFDKYRILGPQVGVLTVSDGGAAAGITVGVATHGIGNTQLRQGGALSVIGNAGSVMADVADIASSANGDVLWNNGGSALGFAPLTFLGTVTTGAWNATPVAATFGGTGQSTYVTGDLLYASASNALARLADVASGSFLRSGGMGVAPSWSAVTLPNAAALGDVMYASAANTYADLPGNTSTTKKFLTQTGTGSASAAPSWDTIIASDLPGSFSGFANPSGLIGMTAANGVATTAGRSDATHAIDAALAPTWTGVHTFSAVPVFNVGQTVNGKISVSVGTGTGVNSVTVIGTNVGDTSTAVTTVTTGDAFYRATTGGVQDWTFGNQRSSGNWILSANTTLGSPVLTVTPSGSATFSGAAGLNGVTPPARITGWGTPTGTGVIASFPGATATLAQCSQVIAQLIKDIKAFGLYGT